MIIPVAGSPMAGETVGTPDRVVHQAVGFQFPAETVGQTAAGGFGRNRPLQNDHQIVGDRQVPAHDHPGRICGPLDLFQMNRKAISEE